MRGEHVEPHHGQPARRFSLLHLMGWTVFAAMLFMFAQAFKRSTENSVESLVVLLVIGVIAICVQTIFLRGILLPQRLSIYTIVAFVLVIPLTITAASAIGIGLVDPMSIQGVALTMLASGGTYCVLLLATLMIVRACGLRLAMTSGERKLPESA